MSPHRDLIHDWAHGSAVPSKSKHFKRSKSSTFSTGKGPFFSKGLTLPDKRIIYVVNQRARVVSPVIASGVPRPASQVWTQWLRVAAGHSGELARKTLSQVRTYSRSNSEFTSFLIREAIQLESEGISISPEVLATCITVGEMVGSRRSVYPSVSTDDEKGLNLFWRAGQREIELEVSVDRSIYLRIVDREGRLVINEIQKGLVNYKELRTAVAELSDEVTKVNPAWREILDAR